MNPLGYELNVPGAVDDGIHAPLPGAYGLTSDIPPPPDPALSRRQRILRHVEFTRQARDKAENDAALDSATEILAREQAGAADAEMRLKRAYDRLGVVAPQMQESQLSMGETLAAVLGGLSGDASGALNSAYALADLRNQREYRNSLTQFEADQRSAGLDADLAGKDLARSQSAMDRLEQFRIGRQADLADQGVRERLAEEERQYRQQLVDEKNKDARIARLDQMHVSAMNRVLQAKDPAQVQAAISEANRYRDILEIPLISEQDAQALVSEAKSRAMEEYYVRLQQLANELANLDASYMGKVPRALIDNANQRAKGLASTYGVEAPPPPFPYRDELSPRGQDVDADNKRADAALQLRREELAGRSGLKVDQVVGHLKAIRDRNQNLANGLDSWEKGFGPRPDGKMGSEIGAIRARKQKLAVDAQVIREKMQKLPPESERTDAQDEEFKKFREELAKLRTKNQDYDSELRIMQALLKTPDPELGPMRVPGVPAGGTPFVGPIGGTAKGANGAKARVQTGGAKMGQKAGASKVPSTSDVARGRGL